MFVSPQQNPGSLQSKRFDPSKVDVSILDTLEMPIVGMANRKTTSKKRYVNFAIRAGVTLLLFLFLFRSLSLSNLLTAIEHINPVTVLLGLLVGTIGTIVSSYQWQALLNGERIHVGIVRLFKLYVVGVAFSHFFPTGMGGDVVKAYYVGQDSGNNAGSASAVVMSRITGFFGMLVVASIALLLWHTYFATGLTLLFVGLSLTVGCMIAGAVFSATLLPRILGGKWTKSRIGRHRIVVSATRIGSALSKSVRRPGPLMVATGFGVLFHIVACLNYYSYAAALNMRAPLFFYFMAIPMISLIAFLPISINGYGLRESAFVYIFSTLHISIATSLLLAFAMDTQVLLFGAFGGFIYLVMGGKVQKGMAIQPVIVHTPYRRSEKVRLSRELDLKRLMMNDTNESFPKSGAGRPPLEIQDAPTIHVRRIKPTPMPSPTAFQQGTFLPAQLSDNEQRVPLTMPAVSRPVSPVDPVSHLSSLPTTKMPAVFSSPFPVMGKQRKRSVAAGLVLCLLMLTGVSGFGYWYLKARPQAVTVYQVKSQNVTQTIGGGGVVFPLRRLVITYPITARVTDVFVKPGDTIAPNQALLHIDLSQLNAQLAQAASDVQAAQAYLNSVMPVQNSVTIAQAQQAYNVALNKYNALKTETSSATLHNGTLYSSMRGVVTSINISPGEFFAGGKQLIVIMDESSVIIRAKIPLSYLGQVHLNQSATVTPSTSPDVNFQGKVSNVIPQADPQTDTFEVWVTVVNSKGILLPGMNAFIRLQNLSKALVVPRLAVLNPDQGSIVFVERNHSVYVQRVHIIGRSIETIYIDSGISAGERVVLVGLSTLRNGQNVKVTRVEGQSS